MIRFLHDQGEHNRASLMSYLLYNLEPKARGFFSVELSAGAHFIRASRDANSFYRVNHTIAFERLMQTIKATRTVRIGFGETVTWHGGSINVASGAGGGVTIPSSISNSGDVEAYVSRHGNPGVVIGISGHAIGDPISVILAHELLGHARLMLLGLPSGQPEAIMTENDIRAGRGIEQRHP